MQERADDPSPAVRRQVARRPHVAHAGVDREDGVVGRHFVQDLRRVLGMNRDVLLDVARVRVDDVLQRVPMPAEHIVEERAVALLLHQRQHGAERGGDVAVHG